MTTSIPEPRRPRDSCPVLAGVIGPPASGKTTLTRELAVLTRAPVISPRSAIRAARLAHPAATAAFEPVNELGWVSDVALGFALRHTLAAQPAGTSLVLLENLPGDVVQLLDLHLHVSRLDARLVLLVLDADDEVLASRAAGRRVCQTCEQDPTADPHAPAATQRADPARCAGCGQPLTSRTDDATDVLRHRTRRHRAYTEPLLRLAATLGAVVVLDAHLPTSALVPLALHALGAESAPMPQRESPSEPPMPSGEPPVPAATTGRVHPRNEQP